MCQLQSIVFLTCLLSRSEVGYLVLHNLGVVRVKLAAAVYCGTICIEKSANMLLIHMRCGNSTSYVATG
jgi:hypothetical protein